MRIALLRNLKAAYIRRWRGEYMHKRVRAYQNGVITRLELYIYFWMKSPVAAHRLMNAIHPFISWYWRRERRMQDRRQG